MDGSGPHYYTIFFDGHCNLCNGFVDFLIKRDPKRGFRYASLQGQEAGKRLPLALRENLHSVVLMDYQGRVYEKSEAVLVIARLLGYPYRMLCLFSLLPSGLLDFFYDRIATNRFLLFGRRGQCRVPTAEESELFFD